MTHPTMRRDASTPLVPRVKVWLECAGHYVFGAGLSNILQAVERSGSIKQAAVDVGQSYRHVWSRIKEAEEALGHCLVETKGGGTGTRRRGLTAAARWLKEVF